MADISISHHFVESMSINICVHVCQDEGSPVPSTSSASASPTSSRTSSMNKQNPLRSSIANKIAAFSSGVAPVHAGHEAGAHEDQPSVEELLHKLEAAGRVGMTN